MGRFDGKVAFITGAARGQGRSHAVRLAGEGADVIAVDRCADIPTVAYDLATPADLAETVRLVQAHGRRVVAAPVDVRDADALEGALRAGVAELGGPGGRPGQAGNRPVGPPGAPRRGLPGPPRRPPRRA